MAEPSTDTSIIRDISLLYELALSAGASLDLRQNCEVFLRMLMARRNLSFAGVWLRNDCLPGREAEGDEEPRATLVYGAPTFRVGTTSLPLAHPQFRLLADGRQGASVAAASDPEGFAALVAERGVEGGVYLLLSLGRLGLLKLYTAFRREPYGERTLHQLRPVIAKFATSLEGCLAYARLRREVQERELAERALRESEEKFRRLIETASDAIFIVDAESRQIVDVNREAEALTGWTRNELTSLDILDLYHAEEQQQLRARFDGFVRGLPRSLRGLCELVHKQGHRVPVELSASTVEVAGRRYALAIMHDVSERLRAEEQRQRLQAQLQQLQRMESLGTLAGGIAHDFNNILGGILGHASLLLRRLPPGDPLRAHAEAIQSTAEHGAQLTQRLLTFARRGAVEAEPVDLNAVVEDTLAIVRRTFPGSIEIEARLAPALPRIEADPAQLRQVVMNLCLNARDAMPHGGRLTVETASVDLAEGGLAGLAPGSYVRLVVADTGIGMDRDTIDRIFEPFFTTKVKEKGTGLGLSIVYGIVNSHGGLVEVESAPGAGARFLVYLPAARATGAPHPEPAAGRAAPAAGGAAAAASPLARAPQARAEQGPRQRILVVDDDAQIRSLLASALDAEGYQVLAAADGLEAVELLERTRAAVDLVVLDMVMPRLDGIATFGRVRALAPHARVVLSSGFSDEVEITRLLDQGADAFVAKPYRMGTLLETVRALLASAAEADGGRPADAAATG
ncbi:MAG: hypothetical protein KatS3mg102_2933 [Planctomycetota bacterium]|nr:MAG: hypothetical protein KatS3mg102_2933 [Planctomycetota bacterium]